jgi:CRISPR-associated protein Cmr2
MYKVLEYEMTRKIYQEYIWLKGKFMSEHLLYISISPVQDFIASARKCQDLWYGSYLLSQLSETCASAIQQKISQLDSSHQQEPLIFPAELSHQSSMESMVANKILVEISAEISQHLSSIAHAGKQAVEKRLSEEFNLAFKKLFIVASWMRIILF